MLLRVVSLNARWQGYLAALPTATPSIPEQSLTLVHSQQSQHRD